VTKNKKFPIFFFEISDSNLAYFVENFIAILTVSLKFLAIENYEKKIRKTRKNRKIVKNRNVFRPHRYLSVVQICSLGS
jgi:hypothetical protein